MLFMVIERYRDLTAVGERFRSRGRMMPDGVAYRASWLTEDGARCYQLMEAPDRATLGGWTRHWSDLVDFEIEPVLASAEFWARRGAS